MIVCHCGPVSDGFIAEVVANGATTVDDVIDECGAGGQCGGCRETIAWLLGRLGVEPADQMGALADSGR